MSWYSTSPQFPLVKVTVSKEKPTRVFGAAILLVVVATFLGVGIDHFRSEPERILGVFSARESTDRVDLLVAERLLKQGALFVDARSSLEFRRGRIPGAINLSVSRFSQDYPTLARQMTGKTLVVYCSNSRCPKAEKLRLMLRARGHRDVRLLEGGMDGWLNSHLTQEES